MVRFWPWLPICTVREPHLTVKVPGDSPTIFVSTQTR